MEINIEPYHLDLLIETISFRLEEDQQLHFLPDVRSDLEELLAMMEDEYL